MPKDTTRAVAVHKLNCAARRAHNPVLREQARLTVAIALEKGLLTFDELHNGAAIATSGASTDDPPGHSHPDGDEVSP